MFYSFFPPSWLQGSAWSSVHALLPRLTWKLSQLHTVAFTGQCSQRKTTYFTFLVVTPILVTILETDFSQAAIADCWLWLQAVLQKLYYLTTQLSSPYQCPRKALLQGSYSWNSLQMLLLVNTLWRINESTGRRNRAETKMVLKYLVSEK